MRTAPLSAALAALMITALLPGTAEAAARPDAAVPDRTTGDGSGPPSASGVLSTAHTAGRVVVADGSARFSWPGVYFEGRFHGTGVGVVLDDPAADYDIAIDGTTVATLVTPGRTTHWVNGLAGGRHQVRVVKRSESPWATSSFGGFVAAPGGAILPRPAPRTRQIEFIGDSYTAGYGNLSETRDCTGDEVNRTTNADQSFGALTARRLNADYQLNAYSGRGMVRNYNGGSPEVTYRTFYDRALLGVDGDVWPKPRTWRPQLVVVGLGINDFSTAVNPGEPWTPESLVSAYEAAYHAFLDKLRTRYGGNTVIVVTATEMSGSTVLRDTAQRIVQERGVRGDDRIRYWYYESAGLDYLGCHWHPSRHDHQVIADRLGDFVATLPLRW